MLILHTAQFKPKPYLKLINKYIFSEGEQFPSTTNIITIHREARHISAGVSETIC